MLNSGVKSCKVGTSLPSIAANLPLESFDRQKYDEGNNSLRENESFGSKSVWVYALNFSIFVHLVTLKMFRTTFGSFAVYSQGMTALGWRVTSLLIQ